MSKALRLVLGVFAAFLTLTILHVWLNIGFEKLNFIAGQKSEESFRVGFLPVT